MFLRLKLFLKGHCKYAYKCPLYRESHETCQNYTAENYYCGKSQEFLEEEQNEKT